MTGTNEADDVELRQFVQDLFGASELDNDPDLTTSQKFLRSLFNND